MIKLTKKTQQAILAHAAAEAPNECCGIVVQVGRAQKYIECKNVAANPAETFEIDSDDWLAAVDMGAPLAVVHSHPGGEPFLSGPDRASHVHSGCPWLLVVGGEIKQFRNCAHLRGRVFEYGRHDCGAIVRDAYMLGGLDLNDHERTQIDDDAAAGHLAKHLQSVGFKRVADMQAQPGDVLLTAHGGDANHAALYLGENEILHHAYDHLSRREPYSRYWQDRVVSVWRHPQWRPEMMQAIENDLIYSG